MNTETQSDTKGISPERASLLRRNLEEPKKISLQDAIQRAIKNYEPIYVMNASDRGGKKPIGHVFISIEGANSGLMIPRTFIPIEVTAMFPAQKLAESPEFLQSSRMHLTLHDPDECKIFLESKEAQAELERLANDKDRFDKDLNQNMRDLQIQVAPDTGATPENDGIQFEEQAGPDNKYGPDRIPDGESTNDRDAECVQWKIFQLINDGETSHDKLLSPLRTTPNLNVRDLEYILKRVRNDSVRAWANHKLDSLKATSKQRR